MQRIETTKGLSGKDRSRTLRAAPRADHRSCRIMKIRGLQFALPLALVAIAISASGRAAARNVSGVSRGAVEAKLSYCKDCHGPSAQGYRGFYPIPRLAGQQPEYLKNQLRAFIERRRPNPIMSNVAHVLKPSMISALAAKFHALNPPAHRRCASAPRGRREDKSFRTGCPTPMLRHAPPVMARTPAVTSKFLAWLVNSIPTSSKR